MHILASLMVRFSGSTFKTFVDYLEVMINKFTISISLYLYGILNERQK